MSLLSDVDNCGSSLRQVNSTQHYSQGLTRNGAAGVATAQPPRANSERKFITRALQTRRGAEGAPGGRPSACRRCRKPTHEGAQAGLETFVKIEQLGQKVVHGLTLLVGDPTYGIGGDRRLI
jgi:hypothetical protein